MANHNRVLINLHGGEFNSGSGSLIEGIPIANLAYLRSNTQIVEGFGTLMQDFRADHYLGKRVRFSALVRTQEAQDWAGLWMRVDKGPKQIAFDNIQGRPIKGTTDWKRYDVVLEVPQEATGTR